jgi:hypothetical protein
VIWVPFYLRCQECGHRNRPHPSPREGIRMAILGQVGPCKRCGATLRLRLPNRPLVWEVLATLAAERKALDAARVG